MPLSIEYSKVEPTGHDAIGALIVPPLGIVAVPVHVLFTTTTGGAILAANVGQAQLPGTVVTDEVILTTDPFASHTQRVKIVIDVV